MRVGEPLVETLVGESFLVLGHEDLGRVTDAPAGSGLSAGDLGGRDRPPAGSGAVSCVCAGRVGYSPWPISPTPSPAARMM